MRTLLYGPHAAALAPLVSQHAALEVVSRAPDVIVCYGGDGTLLGAELEYPGVPKVPIRNSRKGIRLINRPPEEVIARLAHNQLHENYYMKLECVVRHGGEPEPICSIAAMNELNAHMGRINSAVRFKLWIDGTPYENGLEIIGDGFIVCTPFGSTAYYNQITRGVFRFGMGVAFKYTAEHTNHMVLSEQSEVRIRITRGPAVLAYDSSTEYYELAEGDTLTIRKHPRPAVIYTWDEMPYASDSF